MFSLTFIAACLSTTARRLCRGRRERGGHTSHIVYHDLKTFFEKSYLRAKFFVKILLLIFFLLRCASERIMRPYGGGWKREDITETVLGNVEFPLSNRTVIIFILFLYFWSLGRAGHSGCDAKETPEMSGENNKTGALVQLYDMRDLYFP